MDPKEVALWIDLLSRYPLGLVLLGWLAVEVRRFMRRLVDHMVREEARLDALIEAVNALVQSREE